MVCFDNNFLIGSYWTKYRISYNSYVLFLISSIYSILFWFFFNVKLLWFMIFSIIIFYLPSLGSSVYNLFLISYVFLFFSIFETSFGIILTVRSITIWRELLETNSLKGSHGYLLPFQFLQQLLIFFFIFLVVFWNNTFIS